MHSLHAYSLEEMESLKQFTNSFTQNPSFDSVSEVQRLEVGQALISNLNARGKEAMVEKVTLLPCHSSLTPLSKKAGAEILSQDTLRKKYEISQDERSAYEILKESGSLKDFQNSNIKNEQGKSSLKASSSNTSSHKESSSTKKTKTSTSSSKSAGEFVGAFASQPTTQVIKPQNNKIPDSAKEKKLQTPPKTATKPSISTKKNTSSKTSKDSKKSSEALSLEKVMKDSVKTIGRQGAQAITRSLLGGKSSKQMEDIAGNLVSNLLDGWLK